MGLDNVVGVSWKLRQRHYNHQVQIPNSEQKNRRIIGHPAVSNDFPLETGVHRINEG